MVRFVEAIAIAGMWWFISLPVKDVYAAGMIFGGGIAFGGCHLRGRWSGR